MPAEEESRPPVSGIWLLILLVVGILIVGDLTRRMTDARRMERDSQTLATEVVQLEADNQRMQQALEGAGEQAQVESWARSQAKMVQEGERLVIPIPAETPMEGEQPDLELVIHPPSPWEVWWALLGGRLGEP